METQKQTTAQPATAAFFAVVTHPVKLKLYLLKHLPAAFFSGLKVVHANYGECQVSVPYKWFTTNPFRSTYFACLAMGAELSTGILAMASIYGRKPSVSMLITGMEARFHKKATGLTFFLCQDGERVSDAIEAATATGESQEVTLLSRGTNSAGELIAEFRFHWSFKRR